MRHMRRGFLISTSLATAMLLGGAPITPSVAQQASSTGETTAGVTAAVNPATRGTPPVTPPHDLAVGTNVYRQERVETQAEGQAQMLFLDGSSVTVGPDSNVVLDDFVYAPDQDGGKLALSMSKGVARFVGGRLSKQGDVTIKTAVAEIGIRGGVAIIEVDGATGATRATLLYGVSLTIKNQEGLTQRITRPGFTVGVPRRGAPPSAPVRASSATISASLGKLEGRSGASGGSSSPPTDTSVAGSAVAAENSATPLPVGDVVAHAQAEAAAHTASVAQDVQATTVRAVQQAVAASSQPAAAVSFLAYSIDSPSEFGFPDNTRIAQHGAPGPGAAFVPLIIVKSADPFSPSQSTPPRLLQAGLQIIGQGASQVSALEMAVGSINNQSGAAPYNLRAGFMASSRASATSAITFLGTGLGEILPGNQPEFSGTTAPSFFQFDDHQYVGDAIGSTTRQNDIPGSPFFNEATLSTPGQPNTSLPLTFTATQTTLDPAIGKVRTSQTLAGYANGIGTATLPGLANAGSYIIDNASNNPLDVTITTNAATSQLSATFNFTAPTTVGGNPSTNSSATSAAIRANVPVTSQVLQFGTPLNSAIPTGFNTFLSHGTFLDDSRFAARSAEAALQPGTTSLTGFIDTVNGKTVDNSATAGNSIKYLVSGALIQDGIASIVPAGVTLCACEYVQWGFWGGQITTALDQPGSDRRDRFNLATWVAGPLPDPASIPQVGTATYSGQAIGSVFNNGAQYVAVGGFQNSYNFATKSGTVSLTNFDNANYQAAITSANGRDYAGPLTNAANVNVKGSLQGSFYAGAGDPVRETGGKFTVTDLRGLATQGGNLYSAAGIFVGKKH